MTLATLSTVTAGVAVAAPEAREQALQLEVFVNDTSTGLIAAFLCRANGRLAIAPEELRELGLKSDERAMAPDGRIDLDGLPGLSYRLDAAAQVVRLKVDDSRRIPRVYDVRQAAAGSDAPAIAASGYGAVVNYLVFASSDAPVTHLWDFGRQQPAAAVNVDARVFSPFGVLSQTAISGLRADQATGTLRLDTTWTHSDPETAVAYRAGDVISGGLSWTRSVRLGGVQIQSNFGLRPDLVTLPMPNLNGSAAVPSTLDVYINNIRTFSQAIPAGPFEIRNLPIMSGPGTQRIVVRDSLGRETVTDQAFYASPKLLRSGLADFSVEAGFPRLFYGTRSNDYDGNAVASASLRYGVADWLTVETHSEASERLWNGGAGLAMPLAGFGVASFAAAGSTGAAGSGVQFAGSIELGIGSTLFYARTQRTLGEYTDVASTASLATLVATSPTPFSYRPPKELDQVALSFPLPFDPSRLALSYTQLRDEIGGRYQILGASYSRPIWQDVSLFATAYKDFHDTRGYGVFAGVTRAFGNGISATASASTSPSSNAAGVDAIKTQPIEIGSYGWRIRDREGDVAQRSAAASYRAPFARLQAGVEQFGDTARASGEVEGAVVLAGNSVFLTNRVDDAFAVADVGVPGVEVFYENRPVGKTNASGQLLVPYLNAYQTNRLSIDPKNLPVDASVTRTKATVAPADRSGAVVKFGVETQTQSALVSFRSRAGAFVAAGSHGRLDGSNETFLVGYDGQAFLSGLQAQNSVVIEAMDGASCRARFRFEARPGEQVKIENVPCR